MMSLRTNQRLVSLDVFRGLAIICMILVNGLPNFEQAYPLLLHSSWEGLTLADLAFPGFVFAMGAAGALWFPRHLRDHAAKKFYLVFKRSLLLCLLGLVLNQLPLIFQYLLTPDALTGTLGQQIIEHGRVMGVLQRLGLVYFFGMMFCWWLESERMIASMSVALLIVYSLCFHLYAVDASFSPDMNISMLIDGIFPGPAHCYLGKDFDPEGLYGTIAATASMMFGYLAGCRLSTVNAPTFERVAGVFAYGVVLLAAGGLWSYVDIISKPLWTAPYVLITSAIFMFLLGLLQIGFSLLPEFMETLFSPSHAFGMNALFMFTIPDIVLVFLWKLPYPSLEQPFYPWIWERTLKGVVDMPFSILLFAVLWLLCWLPVVRFLNKHHIFIKV